MDSKLLGHIQSFLAKDGEQREPEKPVLKAFDNSKSKDWSQGYKVLDGFLGCEESSKLACLVRERGTGDLREARMGATVQWKDRGTRGDKIAWVTEAWERQGGTMFSALVHKLRALRKELPFDLGDRVSMQLACYEPSQGQPGYVRHSDVGNAEEDEHRVITAIYYLNPGWDVASCGGQLRLFLEDETTLDVEPICDRLLLFRSEIEHQVLSSQKRPRWAVTTWFYSKKREAETIFVAIPSFRDPQCQHTVKDLFEKASRPERVFVGICWQGDMRLDVSTCFGDLWNETEEERDWLSHVSFVYLPTAKARGPTKARGIAQRLWRGEKYLLNVDSHMRFQPNWDAELIQMHQQAEQLSEHGKAVLSTYPSGFELAEENRSGLGSEAKIPNALSCSLGGPLVLFPDTFTDGILRLKSSRVSAAENKPIACHFVAAGFNFGIAREILEDVPYSMVDYLFFGEEVLMSVRLWTRGFDFFAPQREVIHHLWSRAYRPVFSPPEQMSKAASRQVEQFLCDPAGFLACLESDKQQAFTLGSERTLQAFEKESGVSFRDKCIAK